MAITGHQTLKEVERYVKSAEQRKLARAAMAKLAAGQKKNKIASPQPNIQQGGAEKPRK